MPGISQIGGAPPPYPTAPTGTNLAADASILSTAFTAFAGGTIIISVAILSGSPASVLQVVRNGQAYGLNAASVSQALSAGNEYDFSIPVTDGDTINFSFATGTTLAYIEPLFQE